MTDNSEPKQEEDTFESLAPKLPNNIVWTKEHENILIEWADKAMVFRWMHSKAYQQYNVLNMWFTIPVIIMSTLTGTANFAQDKVSDDIKPFYSMGVGAVNIFAGILTTVAQFLKVSELQEAHRVASLSWDKFYRNVKVELAKKPAERIMVINMLKVCKEEFDRLTEISPEISEEVIKAFSDNFSDGVNKIKGKIDETQLSQKAKDYLNLVKPEICATMVTCRESVYKAPEIDVNKLAQAASRLSMVSAAVKDNSDAQFKKKVLEVVKQLKKVLLRDPTPAEVSTELEYQSKQDEEMQKYTEMALKQLKINENNDGLTSKDGNDQNITLQIGNEDNV